MRGIIVKSYAAIDSIQQKQLVKTLSQEWHEHGIILLPNYVDLVAVLDDDADANMLIKCDEVIKNEKAPKIE